MYAEIKGTLPVKCSVLNGGVKRHNGWSWNGKEPTVKSFHGAVE